MNNLYIVESSLSEKISIIDIEYRMKLQRRYINGERYEFLSNMENTKECRAIVNETIEHFEKGQFVIDNTAFYFNEYKDKVIMLPDDFALLAKPNANTTLFWKTYRKIKEEMKDYV